MRLVDAIKRDWHNAYYRAILCYIAVAVTVILIEVLVRG